MNEQSVIELNQHLGAWLRQYEGLVGRDAGPYVREYAIDRTDELTRAFTQLSDEARLLQIGVVGRVKAGKSSLLNALIFDGHPVLPKAATPMTAALTTLAYDEQFHAEVQFYTADDIENMREDSLRYERYLEEERAGAADALRQRRRHSGAQVEDRAFWSDVDRMAARSAATRHSMLQAAHDQYDRIRKAKLDGSLHDSHSKIKARDAHDLANKLLEYVGADGYYMPVTKSVDIYLPLESLRDVRIIDTPGMNDPVQSREARTTELLKNCDVVFIVSPAGQFLSEQDLDMMGRIVQKEGVQELVMVASQVDNQLFGSDTLQPTLRGALDHVTGTLGRHMVGTLQRLKQTNPEVGRLFDRLIEEGAGKIVYTSGICHGMAVRFDKQRSWDSGEKKVWENLTDHYGDFFPAGDSDRCRANLDRLGNIAALGEVLERVRQQKNNIIGARRQELVLSKWKALDLFKGKMLELVAQKIRDVRSANVEDLKKQQRKLNSLIEVATHDLDSALTIERRKYQRDLDEGLKRVLTEAYDYTQETFEDSTSTEREQRVRQLDGVFPWIARKLWDGGREEYFVNVKRVHSQQVINSLRKFARDLRRKLSLEAAERAELFGEQLVRSMTNAARSAFKDDVDASTIIRSVKGVVGAIATPEFELDDEEVRKLKASGVLRESEASAFLEAASTSVDNLREQADSQIDAFVEDLFKKRLPKSIAGDFFSDMMERIDELQQEVEHGQRTMDELRRAQLALEVF
ncbi:hypothetical protein C2U71_21570 [Burkholderia ubonensis]|nr:hypothetical protein C2U71_21570 [Burkholderia ubonensis]